jgi:catechol 2,3-dioxygenase-like lactoylglutathione lyase family enzyme
MPTGYLEHANLTVSDPERSAALLARLCGWRERWRGPSQLGGWTIHCGDERAYVALYTRDGVVGEFAKGVPLNHVGLVVDDLDAAEAAVVAAGLTPVNHPD